MLDLTHGVLQFARSLPTAGHQAVLAALPPEISFIAACFTHSLLPGPNKELRDRLATLRCFLPGSEEVARLKVIFYRACTFAHDPVPEEIFDVIFGAVYEIPWNTSDWDEARVLHVHAVMFMFFALASAHDPALPAFVGVLVVFSRICLYAYLSHQERCRCCILRACVASRGGAARPAERLERLRAVAERGVRTERVHEVPVVDDRPLRRGGAVHGALDVEHVLQELRREPVPLRADAQRERRVERLRRQQRWKRGRGRAFGLAPSGRGCVRVRGGSRLRGVGHKTVRITDVRVCTGHGDVVVAVLSCNNQLIYT
jgi:hypothetical protein